MVIVLILSGFVGYSQVTLSGPTCVTPGLTYLYYVKGDNDTAHAFKICVKGGLVDSVNTTCVEGKRLKFVKINWDPAASTGVIEYSSLTSPVRLAVNIVQPLAPGILSANDVVQGTDSTKLPSVIHCSAASGGSCRPEYRYQWEQSPDNISWSTVSAGIAKDLTFTIPLRHTTYYRRKVKTADSDGVVYTQSAIVFINPPANQQ